MKPLLTIVLTCIGLVGIGQQYNPHRHVDSSGVWYDFRGLSSDMPSTLNSITLIQPHIDTVACWFKEVVFKTYIKGLHQWVECDSSGTPFEQWQRGYSIKSSDSISVTYLYSDRKTKVKNTVTYSIAR